MDTAGDHVHKLMDWGGALLTVAGSRLFALDPDADGSQIYRYDLHAIIGPPALSSDGRHLFVGDGDGNFHGFLHQAWPSPPIAVTLPLSRPGIGAGLHDSQPVMAANGTTVHIGSHDGRLYNVDFSILGVQFLQAANVSFSSTGASIQSSPALSSDGVVFVGSNDGSLYALNDGLTLRWRLEMGGLVGSPALWNAEQAEAAASGSAATHVAPAWSPSTMLFVGSSNGHVHGLRVADAFSAWSFDMRSSVSGPPVVATLPHGADRLLHLVLLSSFDGRIVAVDAFTGALRWQRFLQQGQAGPLAVSEGLVYVGTSAGALFSLDARSGRTLWVDFPCVCNGSLATAAPAVDPERRVVHVGSSEGHVYAYRIDAPAPPPPSPPEPHWQKADVSLVILGGALAFSCCLLGIVMCRRRWEQGLSRRLGDNEREGGPLAITMNAPGRSARLPAEVTELSGRM